MNLSYTYWPTHISIRSAHLTPPFKFSSWATQQHPASPPLQFSRLPHSKPVHQGGGGAGGIHGLKEIIIDWCGPCCWFSWTAAPRRQAGRERERDSQHWLSFTFSSTWHVYEAFSSPRPPSKSVHPRTLSLLLSLSLSLSLFPFVCSPLNICLSLSLTVSQQGGRTKGRWPHQSHRLIFQG